MPKFCFWLPVERRLVANTSVLLSTFFRGPLCGGGSKRAPELPDVRTTTEAGLHDADYLFWVGLFAPSRTPRTVINKMHGQTLKALETASVRDKLAAVSLTPMPTTPEQFDAQIKGELASNAILVKTAGIQPDSR